MLNNIIKMIHLHSKQGQRNFQLEQVIVEMQVLLGEDLVTNDIQLMNDFYLWSFLARRFWAVRPIGNVWELTRLRYDHVIDSIKKLEAVHNAAEQVIRVCFEKHWVENVLKCVIQTDVRFFLNVPKILMIAVKNEDERRNNLVHSLAIANCWKLSSVAEQDVDHNLLNVLFSIEVYVRVCSHDILANQISQLCIPKVLIPHRVLRLWQWIVFLLRHVEDVRVEDMFLLDQSISPSLLISLLDPGLR